MALFASLYLYLVTALFVGGYAYYREVMNRRDPISFTFEHRAILAASAGVVGLFWVLFIPGAMFWYGLKWKRSLAANPRPIRLSAATEARAGG